MTDDQKKEMGQKLQELSRLGATASRLVTMAETHVTKARPSEKEMLEMNLDKLKQVSQQGEEVVGD